MSGAHTTQQHGIARFKLVVNVKPLTQNMSHGVHKTLLAAGTIFLPRGLLGRNEGGHDRAGLVEEEVEGRQAGRDSLRQRAAHHRGIAPHGLQHHTHVADRSPLDGQTCGHRASLARQSVFRGGSSE